MSFFVFMYAVANTDWTPELSVSYWQKIMVHDNLLSFKIINLFQIHMTLVTLIQIGSRNGFLLFQH